MAKVEAFDFPGIELIFHTRNEHPPPHFHAIRSGKWNIRVNFMLCHEKHLDFSVKFATDGLGPSSKEQRKLLELILANRDALLAQWEALVGQ